MEKKAGRFQSNLGIKTSLKKLPLFGDILILRI